MTTGPSNRPAVALTAGDPAGIGPELLVRLLDELRAAEPEPIVVVAARAELERGIGRSGLDVTVGDLMRPQHVRLVELDGDLAGDRPEPSAAAGAWALAALDLALELCSSGEASGILFGPLNKAALHLAGMDEPDEMRWFERRLGGDRAVSEVNVAERFWTSRVTSHVPLREVPDLITTDAVRASISLLDGLLREAGIERPRIAVCALNPHAGEGGLFGDEEVRVIAPAVDAARRDGIDASGPYPCDTLFLRGFDGSYDGIVTMYHDQGQIALKTRSFEGGVTLEAGLDVPICTPAHGTAFDIVGTGRAQLASTRNAYRLLRRLTDARAR